MESWVEIEHRQYGNKHQYTVRLYSRHEDNYISIFTIDREEGSLDGYLHSLNGPGFFKFIARHVREIYKEAEVTRLTAEVLRSNHIMIKRALSGVMYIGTLGTKQKLSKKTNKVRVFTDIELILKPELNECTQSS